MEVASRKKSLHREKGNLRPTLRFCSSSCSGVLIVMERFEKAIRKPSGDTMLSFAREKVGSGWTYGLQEAMDKIGAVSGPVIVAGVLFFRNDNHRLGLAALGIPAVIAIVVVLVTRFLYPDPSSLEVQRLDVATRGFDQKYWMYLLAVGFVAMGFAQRALVAYHFETKKLFSETAVPLLDAVAMGLTPFRRFLSRGRANAGGSSMPPDSWPESATGWLTPPPYRSLRHIPPGMYGSVPRSA